MKRRLWYLGALVRGPGRGLRTLGAAVVLGAAVGASLPAAGGAQSAADLDAKADALRAENEALASGSQTALASLTVLESRLAQARGELAVFRDRARRVRSKRMEVTEELQVARGGLRASQNAIAQRLQTLYEEGDTDVIEVILGSGSLDEAMTAVETLDLAARQDEDLLSRAQTASKELGGLSRALAARERELAQLGAARAAAAASLVNARAERLRTIAFAQRAQNANAGQIAALDRQARTLASAPPTAPTAEPARSSGAPALPAGAASSGLRSLTVTATGYALPGTTASGRPVGWGVVAVDPSVIPMGSRLAIPGYGMGVAADTGGAIVGARIDLWFSSVAQALAWGSRVVTVTIYPK